MIVPCGYIKVGLPWEGVKVFPAIEPWSTSQGIVFVLLLIKLYQEVLPYILGVGDLPTILSVQFIFSPFLEVLKEGWPVREVADHCPLGHMHSV